MSRNRLSFDKSNMSILNDSSIGLQNIGRDSVKHPIRNSSYDGTKMASHKAEDLQHLKKRNAYLQSMIGKIADDRRSVSNVSDLSQENMELRMQRDQYLDQLTKNEDMLWKAREVISHLKSDIHLEALSKNLLQNNGQQNSAIVKPPRNETEIGAAISARSDQKVKELTKKLQMRDTQIQELNQMISQVNLENHNLQTKLIKALEKIKELKTKNQNKGDTSFADHSQIQSAKSDLQKKLDSALQSNYDLFNNYTKIMKDNSELQTKMFSLEEEIMKLRGVTIDKNSNFSLIKATESKVENLEQNISRIEETSFILPQIEQKFNSLKNLHKDKMDAIKLAIQLFHQEVSSTIQSLARNDRQFLSELNTCQNVLTNINSTRGDGKPTFYSFMNSIQNYEVREILEQLQPVKILKPLIQNLMRYFYDLSVEKFHNNVMRNVVFLERKISNIEKLKVSQKKSNVFQNRSKSALVGRKSLNASGGHGHAGYHESNKENSFVNILNNSRF